MPGTNRMSYSRIETACCSSVTRSPNGVLSSWACLPRPVITPGRPNRASACSPRPGGGLRRPCSTEEMVQTDQGRRSASSSRIQPMRSRWRRSSVPKKGAKPPEVVTGTGSLYTRGEGAAVQPASLPHGNRPVTFSSGRSATRQRRFQMFAQRQDVECRTYVHVANDAVIRVLRYQEEDEDEVVSVRFGDEELVLELDHAALPRLVEALTAG